MSKRSAIKTGIWGGFAAWVGVQTYRLITAVVLFIQLVFGLSLGLASLWIAVHYNLIPN
jgi:hypothetical protein